tara:strand:- start:1398 stop:1754 length:357 start_codon:yes stop_codon:yes gene_type:complete
MAQSTENKSVSMGLGLTGGIIGKNRTIKKEEKGPDLPSLEQIREKLSFRHDERMFYWRGHALGEGAYDPEEKVYNVSLLTGIETFPTYSEASKYIDKNKEDILANILKVKLDAEEEAA